MTDPVKTTLALRVAAQPLYQAGIIFVFGLFLALINQGTSASVATDPAHNTSWILMTACVLFYGVCSSVLSLNAKNANRYWRDAILSYVVMMIVSALTAYALSGLSIDEAGSFRWIFIVLAIGYLVFLSIVRLIKRIVDIAIKQDERLRGE